jgi:putative PIG3 family NAD(P)H quinone oxidoreductase
MKAIEISHFGLPEVLKLKEQALPMPGKDEILIKVHYAGVNRPDALQRAGLYNPPKGANSLPGLEVSGEIIATGSSSNVWSKGDLVTALVPGGGYAEYVVTHQSHALPIPKGLNMNQAAALCETFFTVWTNVFLRGNLQKGEKILIHGGSSGIGTTAIQLAKVFGAQVFTTAGTQEKCRRCKELGADLAINYNKDDFVQFIKEHTNKSGVQIILDMMGASYINQNINILSEEGRLILIGFLGGSEATFNLAKIMMKRLVITGSTLRAQSNKNKERIAQDLFEKVWPLISSGKVMPVMDSTFELEDAVSAHSRLEASTHIGKITLRVLK